MYVNSSFYCNSFSGSPLAGRTLLRDFKLRECYVALRSAVGEPPDYERMLMLSFLPMLGSEAGALSISFWEDFFWIYRTLTSFLTMDTSSP